MDDPAVQVRVALEWVGAGAAFMLDALPAVGKHPVLEEFVHLFGRCLGVSAGEEVAMPPSRGFVVGPCPVGSRQHVDHDPDVIGGTARVYPQQWNGDRELLRTVQTNEAPPPGFEGDGEEV
ncbi:hypothetical protein ACFHW2_21390 [Actinomadura sp. LOL_016]|uniref:hypothetical protein n=1 Tax=unclassified Actinomadura TaxID=2626254 RepID=UPI003A80172E